MAIIDNYFQKLIEAKGSDLHLSEGQPPKIRVHGGIHHLSDEILSTSHMDEMMREICEPRAYEKYLSRGDLDFAYEMDDDNRFRCNFFKQNLGHAAVFRIDRKSVV